VRTPLRDVVARLNRYSKEPILLSDGRAGELEISGTIYENHILDWLKALGFTYPLVVTHQPGRMIISRRDVDNRADQSD
jgi:ferric-dicitrate binding protein FerR (iron transport regulator)